MTQAARRPEDPVLLAAAARREEPAVRTLMGLHNQRLFRTARAILRNDAEAEEAVQDAWMKAFDALPGFRQDARLSTWLTRIVANEALTRLRRMRRTAEVVPLMDDLPPLETGTDPVDDQTPMADPPREVARGEIRRMVETRIDALPEAFRTVFVLRAVEEMSVEETAESLGIPEATVRTRFFRARAMLREAIAREVDFAVEDAFGFAGERCERITLAVLGKLASDPTFQPRETG
jgi:RNA polymerase sigma-70 factor (ECF subfamily)